MRKLKSKVEICKLPSMTLVFLPRYREARKLPPSPRWSSSQGIPRKGQAPSWVTPWIASGLPHMQVGLRRAFRQASLGCFSPSSLSSFLPKCRGPCSLRYTVAATPQTRLVCERIKMPKRGVNWANSKFLRNKQVLRLAQLTPYA